MTTEPNANGTGALSVFRPAVRALASLGLLTVEGGLTAAMPVAALYGVALREPLLKHFHHWNAPGELMLGVGALALAALAPFCLDAAETQYDRLRGAIADLRSASWSQTRTAIMPAPSGD